LARIVFYGLKWAHFCEKGTNGCALYLESVLDTSYKHNETGKYTLYSMGTILYKILYLK